MTFDAAAHPTGAGHKFVAKSGRQSRGDAGRPPMPAAVWDDPTVLDAVGLLAATSDPEVVRRMAGHPNRFVRQMVPEHPLADADVIRALGGDKDTAVRLASLSRPDVTPAAALASDPSSTVRLAYMWHPGVEGGSGVDGARNAAETLVVGVAAST
jgi:hypothetical protein